MIWVGSNTDLASLAETFAELSPAIVILAALSLFVGALCASLRVWLIAHDLGYPLRMRDAVAALSIGQLAGGIFFQLVGQLIARGALLARRGLPVSVTVVLTGYERVVAFSVSLALALAGGWLIFGRVVLDLDGGGLEFLELAIGLILAVLVGGVLGWGRRVVKSVTPHLHGRLALLISRSVCVSVATQLCTMVAYVVLARAFSPSLAIEDLAAASAVVMLAASLPISLAGWGVREVSAVLALGAIGMSPEEALVVAVLVGSMALGVVATLALLTAGAWRREDSGVASRPGIKAPKIDYGTGLVWALPLTVATAVFFQVYVPTGTGQLNVNFADPAAIMGGTLFVIWAMRDRAWPQWRLSGFNIHVFAASSAFIIAFIIGWNSFGWTAWAFTSKLVGWFVLLGYGATGALLVSRAGTDGLSTLLRTIAAAGLAVLVIDLTLLILRFAGVQIPENLLGGRIEGFSINANAFAFQLILTFFAALLAFRDGYKAVVIPALILAGVWFAGSRASFGAILVALPLALCMRPKLIGRVGRACLCGLVIVIAVIYLPAALLGGDAVHGVFTSGFADSDAERMLTLEAAWQMFLDSPLFGAGLGAFVHDHMTTTGEFLVIHSTPLWLLAEFGLFGALLIGVPFVRVALNEIRRPFPRDDAAVLLIGSISAFAVMSLAHEMMYQRLFWLVLGAGLALTVTPTQMQRSATR
ncbi:hypothetical protein GCM10007276_09320 [Agaricicola taiwanensis]|uniref:O-antigen ligase-related domain-containing protein n=1 Tax=Agaricicola taiwanensis TaxID=591372 RepID=A0A8J2VMX4_9RHOB|nr:hypothetical protein GCM10007276_09320 [Agaricicola taiwanensis]